MIRVLIDSSDTDLRLGIAEGKNVLFRSEQYAWQRQSELLIVELDRLLKENGYSRHDIECVIASKGPGSYTGVRIALTVAKVMAFSIDKPLYLASSLEVLRDPKRVSVCVMNARSKRSYVGVYSPEGVLKDDCVMENEELKAYLAEHPDYLLCGNASHLGLEGAQNDLLSNLASSADEMHQVEDVLAAKPVYLKDSYATV